MMCFAGRKSMFVYVCAGLSAP